MDRKSGSGSSQDRRRFRRAAERAEQNGTSIEDELAGIRSLAASASGSKSLPLSPRDTAWDGDEAAAAVAKWASSDGSGDTAKIDWDKYGQAFAWKDSEGGDAIGDYKLGFADVLDGKLTAIFKGVTAAAGAIQGARGGVDIPDGDVAGVKTVLASYYSKAADEYDDDGIKPPWEADEKAGQSAAHLLAYAEVEKPWTVTNNGKTENGEAMFTLNVNPAYLDSLKMWSHELGVPAVGADASGGISGTLIFDPLPGDHGQFGGKPSKGTEADKRLRRNQPEDLALEAIASLEEAAASLPLLTAAAGDVAWGPEEGFMDLLCDLNVELNHAEPNAGYNADQAEWYGWPRVVDVSTDLKRALICDGGDDYYVSAISGKSDDDSSMLSPRDEWTPVESGWIETSMAVKLAAHWPGIEVALTADGALDPPVPPAHEEQEELPPRRPGPPPPPQGDAGDAPTDADEEGDDDEEDEEMGPDANFAWTATFVPEGTLTDDRRAFAPGGVSWRELPLTLMAMTETSEGGHIGAELAGRIDAIWREGNLIKAGGIFDSGEYGTEIERMVGDRTLRGLSVDIAIHEYETGPVEKFFDEQGDWRAEPLEMISDPYDPDVVFVVTKGVIGMATVCPFPAFAEASISLAASAAYVTVNLEADFTLASRPDSCLCPPDGPHICGGNGTATMTASAAGLAPLKPPAEWFDDPGFEEVTPLTIDEDGRIYGHAWTWETCHLAFPDSCVVAPHTQTENAYYHLGQIECEDGSMLPVGKVTLDTGHAGQRLGRADAIRHYDDTGTVAAHVCAGEDEFGGWFAGAIAPDLSEEKLRLLRGAVLSGDWRNVNGNLELIALLAVNVPGFPVPRTRALVASSAEGDEWLALTAAAINLGPPSADEQLAEIADLATTE